MKQFAVAHGWRGTCIYNSRNSYLNAQCGACVQIYRKFATQLVKAPLVLALTEAASAHVHVFAENMALKSWKGGLAPLWRQKIRAEYRILHGGRRCPFEYKGNFAAGAPSSLDSCFVACARRFMDAYRQHSAPMFLVKRHGEHCARVYRETAVPIVLSCASMGAIGSCRQKEAARITGGIFASVFPGAPCKGENMQAQQCST